MWVEIKRETDIAAAQKWKDTFEKANVPARILPAGDRIDAKDAPAYRVLVSEERVHVVNEILRKMV
jgi:hypothetical protein